MAHVWKSAVALQKDLDLVRRPSARSGDNVFFHGLAVALAIVTEFEKLGCVSYHRQYVLPPAGRAPDRSLSRHKTRVR